MNPEENQRLLQELLSGEESSGLRRRSLEHLLHAARAKRARRALLRGGVLLLVGVGLIVAGVLNRPSRPIVSEPGMVARTSPPNLPAATTPERVKIISDEELFALFPNRPLALIGVPGHQRLVFLDEQRPQP